MAAAVSESRADACDSAGAASIYANGLLGGWDGGIAIARPVPVRSRVTKAISNSHGLEAVLIHRSEDVVR